MIIVYCIVHLIGANNQFDSAMAEGFDKHKGINNEG